MAYLNDRVLDLGLNVLDTEADVLYICSAEPTSYAEAISLSLGVKTGISVGAEGDATPDGRKVTVAAITDGSVTASGTATHWAIVDVSESRLLAVNTLGTPTEVVVDDTFTLPAFDVRIPDPA